MERVGETVGLKGMRSLTAPEVEAGEIEPERGFRPNSRISSACTR
jgi:hypothetical protein